MGYQSTFDIRAKLHKAPRGITGGRVDIKSVIDDLKKLEPNESFSVSGSDGIVSIDETYWYDYADHMKQLSAMYEGVLFTVQVHGEEPGDSTCHYYYGGKTQKAEITYTPFDESALEE